MLQEVQPEELHIGNEPTLVYFYTPFCGTCAEAKKMLEIALQSLPIEITAVSCNMNYASHLARKWEIASVPCLLLFKEGEIQEKIYAFHSASFLFNLLDGENARF